MLKNCGARTCGRSCAVLLPLLGKKKQTRSRHSEPVPQKVCPGCAQETGCYSREWEIHGQRTANLQHTVGRACAKKNQLVNTTARRLSQNAAIYRTSESGVQKPCKKRTSGDSTLAFWFSSPFLRPLALKLWQTSEVRRSSSVRRRSPRG